MTIPTHLTPPSLTAPELSRPAGQFEPLTVRLSGLIRGYPKGLGIIKEFLQNGDDAAASRVDVTLDLRSHPMERCPSAAYARLAGPALVITNDAVFTDPDFVSLQAIGQSEKRTATGKIGKFGLGFNAAYNVTDHPMVLSRDRLIIFDPNKSIVGEKYSHPGTEFPLCEALWERYPDLLDLFTDTGLEPGATSFPATVFRLPLRAPVLAAESGITHEPFLPKDFEEIVRKIEERAADLLLFLQRVESLTVSRISTAGMREPLVSVTTVNVDDVRTGRAPVQVAAADRRDWRPCEKVFRHDLRITTSSGATDAAWRVAVGLYAGPDDVLTKLAAEMWEHDERALPLAGAAARITSDAPTDGRAYCGLPLARATQLPVHLNGFFELDSNRDWLRLNTETAGTQEHRRQRWNRALLEHGVAEAYATLIEAAAADAAREGATDVFALLPAPNEATEASLPGVVRAVYTRLAERNVALFRTRAAETPWQAPAMTQLLPLEWVEPLTPPLAANGWPIADPPVPAHVAAGFVAAQHPLQTITPKYLRDRWRRSADINCALEDADEPAWRQREWVIELAAFCAGDGLDHLIGLPLAILCDGNLHTFGHANGGLTFIEHDRERELFPDCPHWFLDPEMAQRCGIGECVAAKLVRMSAKLVLLNLKAVVGAEARYSLAERDDAGAMARWLERLFDYLADEKALADAEHARLFKQVPLIPDQFGELRRAGAADTPLRMPANTALDARLLKAFRVPVVTGRKALKHALQRALELAAEPLVPELTGPALVARLASTTGEWADASPAPSHLRVEALRFLALKPEAYSDAQLEMLRTLPLLSTKDGVQVTAADPDVVLPSSATFPTLPSNLKILKSDPKTRDLLDRLGVRRLNQAEYLRRVLGLDFTRLERSQGRELLTWVRDHLHSTITKLPPDERDRLRDAARCAVCIEGTDGALHALEALYDDGCTIARDVMGERAVYPDMAGAYARDPDLWRDFFGSLHIARTIRPGDFLAFVDAAIDAANVDLAAADFAPLQAALSYIRAHWDDVSSQTVVDADAECTLPEALARRAWLPPQLAPERLARFAGYRIPEKRLYRAIDMYDVNQGHLVASCAPIVWGTLPLRREVRRGLGFPAFPNLSLVIRHFEQLLDRWALPEHGELDAATLPKSLGAIYRAIGGSTGADPSGDDEEENEPAETADLTADELRHRFADRACLWSDRIREFVRPSHAFARPVPFFGQYRVHIAVDSKDAAAVRGYDALGRRQAPDAGDLIAFLMELQDRYDGAALSEADQSYVLAVLHKLAAAWQSPDDEPPVDVPNDLPLLAHNGRLVPATAIYRNDDTYRGRFIDMAAVDLVHPDVPVAFQYRLELRSLAGALHEVLDEKPRPATDTAFIERCHLLQHRLRSPELARGIERLLRHASGSSAGIDLDWLCTVDVTPVAPFTVELWLADGDDAHHLGSAPLPFHWAFGDNILLLSDDGDDDAEEHVIDAINMRLGGSAFTDRLWLHKLLTIDPSRIDATLSRRGIRPLAEDVTAETDRTADIEDGAIQRFDVDDDVEDDASNETFIEIGEEIEAEDDGLAEDWTDDNDHDAENKAGDDASTDTPNDGTVDHGDADVADDMPRSSRPRVPDPNAIRTRGWTSATDRSNPKEPRSPGTREPSARRDRVVTYLVGSSETDRATTRSDDAADDETPWNRHVGDTAEIAVVENEIRAGLRAERQPRNNKGYDILVDDPATGERRYVEVKGLVGAWTERGVALSAPQFEMAQREHSAYWVYVVEFALDPARRRIHRIANPVERITQYRLDHGWRGLAETAVGADVVHTPQVGSWIRRDDGEWGEIRKVVAAGALTRLTVRWKRGTEEPCLFRPSIMTVHLTCEALEVSDGADAP